MEGVWDCDAAALTDKALLLQKAEEAFCGTLVTVTAFSFCANREAEERELQV